MKCKICRDAKELYNPHSMKRETCRYCMKRELRLLDKVKDYNLLDLKIVFSGTMEECEFFAKQNDYIWKEDQNLFGGYYVHPATRNCLFIT